MPTQARGSMRVFELASRGLTANARQPNGRDGASRLSGRAVQYVDGVGDCVGPERCRRPTSDQVIRPGEFHDAPDGPFRDTV
eukprot:1992728-Pleurochrysis_carterae.AAC.3